MNATNMQPSGQRAMHIFNLASYAFNLYFCLEILVSDLAAALPSFILSHMTASAIPLLLPLLLPFQLPLLHTILGLQRISTCLALLWRMRFSQYTSLD